MQQDVKEEVDALCMCPSTVVDNSGCCLVNHSAGFTEFEMKRLKLHLRSDIKGHF